MFNTDILLTSLSSMIRLRRLVFWLSRWRLGFDPSGRAFWGACLRPIACWDWGFESLRGQGCSCCLCCKERTKGKARTKQYKVQRGGGKFPGQSTSDFWWTKWILHVFILFPFVFYSSTVLFYEMITTTILFESINFENPNCIRFPPSPSFL